MQQRDLGAASKYQRQSEDRAILSHVPIADGGDVDQGRESGASYVFE
jgi:hypothetical protein